MRIHILTYMHIRCMGSKATLEIREADERQRLFDNSSIAIAAITNREYHDRIFPITEKGKHDARVCKARDGEIAKSGWLSATMASPGKASQTEAFGQSRAVSRERNRAASNVERCACTRRFAADGFDVRVDVRIPRRGRGPFERSLVGWMRNARLTFHARHRVLPS